MAYKPLTRLSIWAGVLLASWALFLGLMWGISQITAHGMSLTQAATAHLTPPARYDHEPDRPYTVHIVSNPKVLRALCFHRQRAHLLGCAALKSGRIFIREGLSRNDHALVLRHEKAHLNGWFH